MKGAIVEQPPGPSIETALGCDRSPLRQDRLTLSIDIVTSRRNVASLKSGEYWAQPRGDSENYIKPHSPSWELSNASTPPTSLNNHYLWRYKFWTSHEPSSSKHAVSTWTIAPIADDSSVRQSKPSFHTNSPCSFLHFSIRRQHLPPSLFPVALRGDRKSVV